MWKLEVLSINVFFLLPIALCVGLSILDGVLGVLLAYVPLVALALRFRAGALERNDL
ncbi:hypothetical protein [Pseudomonas lactis]|uniref:hypothetical protein n=1 Tax=Pseudomonas lactis TaxID=1615674 RepID=UPI001F27B35F|nr:hypothetical protein [Pseudomonas lactis]MCF5116773.1 hypothetical protein [Pseudomonas lactis]